jgi:hypothetical protein
MGNHMYGNKNDDKNYSLIIYHQNIQGLKIKISKFMLSLFEEIPHLICLSEHHLKYNEVDITHIPTHKLGAKYCRTSLKCGGVCVYIHKNIEYSDIDLQKYCLPVPSLFGVMCAQLVGLKPNLQGTNVVS